MDILAFYWLLSITQPITQPYIKNGIYIAFWTFTAGLISSILILKIRLDDIDSRRKQLLVASLFGLTVSSFIPKILFVIVISLLYFTNYVFSEKTSLIIIPIFGLFSGLLPFFVIVYAIFRSLYRFKVHHINIKIKDLSDNLAGLSIVQISDLHLGSFNFRYHILDRAVKLINQLNPDLIFFTGDLVNNHAWELKGWDLVLNKLTAKKGKYSVLGNHDYGDYSQWGSIKAKRSNHELIKYFYEKIDFKLLVNESEIIEIDEEKLAILGVENWGMPPFKQYGDLNKAIKKVVDIPFKILLSHDPSHWSEEVVKDTDIVLTLSGHTHGMQAAINFKNKKWSPIKFKYKHWAGLYKDRDQYLHVNRGLGWLAFPGRIGMRPEITHIEFEAV
ncbi:MAG: metallophosphoesterase [Aureibaculum sp.]|nr:metallophosphoesterase [Aureibaculum sp.]